VHEGRKSLIAVDAVPSRELAPIGSYVRFVRPYKVCRRYMNPGEMAVVTADTKGKCVHGRIAIRLPGMSGYTTVPTGVVEVVRGPS